MLVVGSHFPPVFCSPSLSGAVGIFQVGLGSVVPTLFSGIAAILGEADRDSLPIGGGTILVRWPCLMRPAAILEVAHCYWGHFGRGRLQIAVAILGCCMVTTFCGLDFCGLFEGILIALIGLTAQSLGWLRTSLSQRHFFSCITWHAFPLVNRVGFF